MQIGLAVLKIWVVKHTDLTFMVHHIYTDLALIAQAIFLHRAPLINT